jgi:hypothetical protein
MKAKMPQRTVHPNASNDTYWAGGVAEQLANRIIGKSAHEQQFGSKSHAKAEAAAEKLLMKALHNNKGGKLEKAIVHSAVQGIPINVDAKLPRTKYTYSMRNMKHPENGKMTSVFNIKGTDWLTDVTVATTDAEGKVLYDSLIHPKAFAGTRLATFATLFDKYIFKKFSVDYHPSAATTTSGSMLGYCDYDPNADITQTLKENVRKGASHYGMSLTHLFDKDKWDLKEIPKDALFFCDPSGSEDRLVYQGRFLLLCAETTSTSLDCGEATITFDCDFYISQIENVITNNGAWYEATGTPTTPTASIPFGTVIGATAVIITAPTNMDVQYNPTTYSIFTLPAVAVNTVFYCLFQLLGTGITTVSIADGASGVSWTLVYGFSGIATSYSYLYKATVTPGGAFQLVKITFATVTTCTTASIMFWPIPTAITLQHNNKKEMFSAIESLEQKVDRLEKYISSGDEVTKVWNEEVQSALTYRDPVTPKPRRNIFI